MARPLKLFHEVIFVLVELFKASWSHQHLVHKLLVLEALGQDVELGFPYRSWRNIGINLFEFILLFAAFFSLCIL